MINKHGGYRRKHLKINTNSGRIQGEALKQMIPRIKF
jgi:hypothetical protein